MPGSERGGLADVVYVLCLMQASFLVLAGVGEVLMMGGNGIYVIASLIKAAALLWLGAGVVRSRRWALITLIVLQALTLAAIPVQIIIGLVPAVEFAPSLVELLTGVVVPMAMIAMCALLLGRRRQHQARTEKERAKAEAATYEMALAKDPYAGWGVSR